MRQRLGPNRLPRNNLDAFYEQFAFARLETLEPIAEHLPKQFNEVMPLLYTSLKLDLFQSSTSEYGSKEEF